MYDLIVIGTGGVGSAVVADAARRGLRVLGLDRHKPPHTYGSSHGESRVIRRSYFEHSDYVPLLSRAYELWDSLNHETGQTLFVRSGLVYYLNPNGPVALGVRGSSAEYSIELESVTAEQAARRWPQFLVPDGCDVLFEPDAGFLRVEDCIAAQLSIAAAFGADTAVEEVLTWTETPDHVRVTTQGDVYTADRLIVTAGSWATRTLHDIGLPLRVVLKQLHWFPVDESHGARDKPVCFFYEVNDGYFYGFPDLGNGVKVAEHSGGVLLEAPESGIGLSDERDTARVADFVREFLRGPSGESDRTTHCLYTMTPDENFVIDRHPVCSRVTFAAGLSGHGFKFAPALAELLLHLSLNGGSDYDVEFLSLNRFNHGI